MAAVTGAIWKCATNNADNVDRFKELELLPILIQVKKYVNYWLFSRY